MSTVPVNRERECDPQYRSDFIPHFDRYLAVALRAAVFPDRFPCHIRKGAGRFLLHGFEGTKFKALVIGEDVVPLSHIEIVALH
jgi:hypothetical protein